jgi:hypothetical protein
MALDQVYAFLGVSAKAMAGHATELIPPWVQVGGAVVLLALTIRPVYRTFQSKLMRGKSVVEETACDCTSEKSLSLTPIHLEDAGCPGSS